MTLKLTFSKLASQFRLPSGEIGKKVGKQMDELNNDQNDWVLSLLDLQSSDNVLEVGFGTGKTLEKITRTVKQGKIYGIDPSETMSEVAKKLLENRIIDGRIKLIKNTLADSILPDNFFTKILSVHVVYFWDNLEDIFKKVYFAATDGAFFAIYYVSPILSASEEFHEYSQDQIISAIKLVGFNKIEIKKKKFNKQNGICILAVK